MQPAFLHSVFQIVFNEISAAEMSKIDTLEQLDIFDAFEVSSGDLENLDDEKYGKIERDGKVLYRFRTDDYRVYFEVVSDSVVIHRVLHKGTLSDFLFRSTLGGKEDDELAESKHFWNLIDEGRNARTV